MFSFHTSLDLEDEWMLGSTSFRNLHLVFNMEEKNFDLYFEMKKNGQWVDNTLFEVEDEGNIDFNLDEVERLRVSVYIG